MSNDKQYDLLSQFVTLTNKIKELIDENNNLKRENRKLKTKIKDENAIAGIVEKKESDISEGEKKCKSVLKNKFPGHEFVTIRPDWLKNKKTKRNLELDLYCDKLKLAVEYNGEQHYKHSDYFHKKKSLEDQVERDDIKIKLCKKMNIFLIVISYDDDIEVVLNRNLEKYKKTNYYLKLISDDVTDETSYDISDDILSDQTNNDKNTNDISPNNIKNPYITVVNEIIEIKPKWYDTNKYIPKKDVYKRIVSLMDKQIANNVFWQKMKNMIVAKEKLANNDGKREYQIKLKKLW